MDVKEELAADLAAIAGMPTAACLLDALCRTTGMGFAAVARVTVDRWIACGVADKIDFGLKPGDELAVETTICREVRLSGGLVAIDHVAVDGAYAGHPTPALYGFESYISAPILLADGSFFGTLFAIDPQPKRVNTPETIAMIKLFADLIAFQLDAHYRLVASEAVLRDERRTSALREQFIAVLGHDLRNPVASMEAAASLLLRTPLNDTAITVVGQMRQSVGRMVGLIDDVLDFARGQLGGGLSLDRRLTDLTPVLTHVASELSAKRPDQAVELAIHLPNPVLCDGARIGQLLSNLLGNALTHGAADAPVRVRAREVAGNFELSVSNQGAPIPREALERLFEPFERGVAQPGQQGLGLGLYIAREVARAHGGKLTVASSPEETVFVLLMPMERP